MKTANEYSETLGRLFTQCPKHVIAAIAVSSLTTGGDFLEKSPGRFLMEWWTLYDAGIVPQKPAMPRPKAEDR